MILIFQVNGYGKMSCRTFLSFFWLIKTFQQKLTVKNHLCNNLKFNFKCIDFAHIPANFLRSNDNLLNADDSIQLIKV